MLIHDSIYSWEGWGGKLRLASGKCRLRIYDRRQGEKSVTILRPYIVVVSDVPDSKMSIRSCAGHIATTVVREFRIDPSRMIWIEYYPAIRYGKKNEYRIAEQFVTVDFTWREGRAINPKWREINPPLLDIVQQIVETAENAD